MLCLPVPPEVHLPLEAFSAQVAAKGLEACVLAAVGDEVGALAECLATHLALVGLLAYRDGRERGKQESMIKLAETHSDPQDPGSSWLHHSLRPLSSLRVRCVAMQGRGGHRCTRWKADFLHGGSQPEASNRFLLNGNSSGHVPSPELQLNPPWENTSDSPQQMFSTRAVGGGVGGTVFQTI